MSRTLALLLPDAAPNPVHGTWLKSVFGDRLWLTVELTRGSRAHMAGLITLRQQPATAKSTTFVTLEDEDGMVNVMVWPDLAEHKRRLLLAAKLFGAEGRRESVERVQHLVASRLHDHIRLLGTLDSRSRDFR